MMRELTVRVECLTPEKLLERALSKGARFSLVRRDGPRGLVVECDAVSAEVLLDTCARYRIDARVLARRGRSALSQFLRRRATLPVGLMVFAALCWLFLGRVWIVETVFSGEAARLGNIAALQSAVRAAGVRVGMPRDLDLKALEQALAADAGDYSYVGAHLRGVRLVIEAVPEVPAPPVYDVSAARDLVADRDGVVISAVVRSGALCVQPGDAVRRGQLLIRGEEQATSEETRPIAALGEVIVRAWFTGEASMPLSETVARPTGRQSASLSLVTPWFHLPIESGEAYAEESLEAALLPVGGLFVPVGIERVTRREMQTHTVPRNDEALRRRLAPLALADAALKLCREGPESYEIRSRWVDCARVGDRLVARAVIEISADAAVTRDTLNH